MKSNIFKRTLSLLLSLMCIIGTITVGISSIAADNSDVQTTEVSDGTSAKNEYKIVSPVPLGSFLDTLFNLKIS